MKSSAIIAIMLGTLGWGDPTYADDQIISVASLLKQGFDVAGVISPTSAGVGLFMRKADKLYACFVSETPTSTTLATRYCKAVE